jgi:hypothetical protein
MQKESIMASEFRPSFVETKKANNKIAAKAGKSCQCLAVTKNSLILVMV